MSAQGTTGTGGPDDGAAPRAFRLDEPLPRGTTLLEASAGTGKTWTIAALVARYVAEAGLPVEQLLVMTFSRESTRELRERVRARLVEARDALARPAADPDDEDELLRLLRRGTAADVALRQRRLADALASFDAATVTTTHGFCQRVLLTLGATADHDPRTQLVEDVRDVVHEVAHDFYLRRWGVAGAEEPALSPDAFRTLAETACGDPATVLLPLEDEAVPALPALRARVARRVRAEVQRRLRAAGQMGYDDLLLRLAQVLEDPVGGPRARARLRAQHRVVLVDEFQDTDPVQWRVLRAAFHESRDHGAGSQGDGTPARALVLVGDPKQAVYGFRGADVRAYLDARDAAGELRTLATNQRSDEPVLRGLDAVLAGAALGDARIRVRPLAARWTGRRLTGVPPVRLRVVPRDGLPLTQSGEARVGGMRERVVRDVAAQVVALVGGDVRTTTRPRRRRADHPSAQPDGPPPREEVGDERPLEPGDVAVLVRTNAQAQMVRAALEGAGVPVVVGGRTSVFATPAAEDWTALLEALEQPRPARVRRLTLGALGGHDAASLDAGGDALVDDLALRVRGWARLLDARGVGALLEAVSRPRPDVPGLAERLLAEVGGERRLTDLRHVGQVLHEAAVTHGLGVSALLVWLRERVEEAGRDGGVERSRRLESDAAAVQVLTVHTSKGLEFPAVLVPFAWDMWQNSKPSTALVHDAEGRRCRDVGGVGAPGWAEHVREHHRSEADEELRLAYVALTRAASHLTVWWAGTSNTGRGPLHRLLLHGGPANPVGFAGTGTPGGPASDDGVPPQVVPVPSDDDALAALTARAAGSGGSLVVERAAPPVGPVAWSAPPRPAGDLAAAPWRRTLDQEWRRTSYSALTAAAHDAGPAGASPGAVAGGLGEAEGVPEDDERLPAGGATSPQDARGPDPAVITGGGRDPLDVVSPWDGLVGGARFGVLVHAVLEELDPSGLPPAPEDGAPAPALRALVAEHAAAQGVAVDVDGLAVGLDLALRTPLGPLGAGLRLVDVTARDRLPELDFELPLAGGDDAADARPTLAGLVPLWRRHCPDGPLAGYADALADLTAAEDAALRGYLTGSVDAVLRLPAGPSEGVRHVVVDYKTNRLGSPDRPLTAADYREEALVDAMVAAHYPLQALLYQVALHRFLRWRLPGYAPEQHLGGALYLFVRGMVGPQVPAGADGAVPGVMAWATPPALVVAASDHLAGRDVAAGAPGARS